MLRCKRILVHAVFLLFTSSVFCLGADTSTGCKVPHYRVGKVWTDTISEYMVDLSVPWKEFTPQQLVCLARSLKRQHPGRTVSAYMFTSYDAARSFTPLGEEYTPQLVAWARELRASYIYDHTKREEYLLLTPDGLDQLPNSPFNTRIDLPTSQESACKLAIQGRCLLAFRSFIYPFDEKNVAATGEVTLSGTIRKDGALSKVTVVNAKADSPDHQSLLLNAAVKNFTSWHFEPAPVDDAVRITYSFELIDAPKWYLKTHVQFRLPDQVKVQTSRAR